MYKFFKRIKNNKYLIILSFSIIVVFLLLITKVTYAYVIYNNNQSVKKQSDDLFSLSVESPLKLVANEKTFQVDGLNYVTSTSATATLKSGIENKETTYNYYLYFEIMNNTFNYSNAKDPEIILTITDPNGDIVTNVEGLIYGTFNGVSGFDITTLNGFYVINEKTITLNSNEKYTTHEWKFTLTYLNQPFDQTGNNGSSMDIAIYMEKEERNFTKVKLESSVVSVEDTAFAFKNITNSKKAIFKTNATLENSIVCTNGATAVIDEDGLVTININDKETTCTIN